MYFSELLKIVYEDWPKVFDFGSLEYYDMPDDGSGYCIENLMNFPSEIDRKYDNHILKIIFINLNYTIYNLLGCSARDFNKVNIRDFRMLTLKRNFEYILQDILECSDIESDWNKEAIEIAREYFRVNYPEGHPVLDKRNLDQ